MATNDDAVLDGGGDDDRDDDESNNRFDLDAIASFEELNRLSRDIEGPIFDPADDIALEEAKDALWEFVEGNSEKDLNKMCMGQLNGVMENLTGKPNAVPEHLSLDEARDYVWDYAVQLQALQQQQSSCCGCGNCPED